MKKIILCKNYLKICFDLIWNLLSFPTKRKISLFTKHHIYVTTRLDLIKYFWPVKYCISNTCHFNCITCLYHFLVYNDITWVQSVSGVVVNRENLMFWVQTPSLTIFIHRCQPYFKYHIVYLQKWADIALLNIKRWK